MIKTYYCFLTTVISLTIFLSCKEESKKVYLEKDIKKEIIGEQDQIDLKATQSILQKAKKACPELVGIGIGIDPLMANWETLPKLSIELKKIKHCTTSCISHSYYSIVVAFMIFNWRKLLRTFLASRKKSTRELRSSSYLQTENTIFT